MNTNIISLKIIRKAVKNSQKIEGYSPVSKEVAQKAKMIMKHHNVKVSA